MERQPNIRDFSQYRRSRQFNPIFDLITDDFDNNFKEKSFSMDTIIEKLYSDVPLHKEIMTLFVKGKEALTATDEFSIASPHSADESIYLLQGKKGMGKTMLLYRFYYLAKKGKVDGLGKSDILIYLDLRDRRTDAQFKATMPQSLLEQLFYWIYENQPYLKDPKSIRKISDLYKHFGDAEVCERVLNNKEEALTFLLKWLRNREIKVFLIVDNLDDFPRESIVTIFDFCHRLKSEFSVKSCLALRDYWSPKILKIDDKIVCTVTLPPPNVQEIFEKRIYNIDHTKVSKKLEFTYDGIAILLEPRELLDIFNEIVKELTQVERKDLYGRLFKLTNYNTREFLINMYHYFHSPYLFAAPNFTSALVKNIRKVDPEYRADPQRELRLHDFLQSFMAVHSLCYDKDASTIFNVFFHNFRYANGWNYRNTLLFVRILQTLQSKTGETTDVRFLVEQLTSVGYVKTAVIDALNELLKEALVESVDGIDAETVSNITLSAKGSIYLEEVVPEFNYLLMVSDVVPMEDRFQVDVNRKFGTEAIIFQRGNLALKQEGVLKFVDFIRENEEQESTLCPDKYSDVLLRIKRGVDLNTSLRASTEKTIRLMTSLSKPHKHRGITNYKISK